MEIQVSGSPAHTRSLGVTLRQAEPGRLAVHATILDLRKRGLVPMAGDLQAAGVIHHMRVDGRIACDGPTIETLRAAQPQVAFEPGPGTGGECCRDPVRRIEALEGTRLDDAYAQRLGAAIGGPRGCSHVLTLAQLLGSATTSALATDIALHDARPSRPDGQRIFTRSLSIDGLEQDDGSLALALQLADIHFAPTPRVAQPLERLALQRELRVEAVVELTAMRIARVRAAERTSDAGSLTSAAWTPRDVSFLDGHPALGGMARTLFARLPARDDAPLRDVLLNLAPAVIQCVPSLTRHWQRWREKMPAGMGAGGASAMPGGGMVDSCYMWRRDGAMGRLLARVAPEPGRNHQTG